MHQYESAMLHVVSEDQGRRQALTWTRRSLLSMMYIGVSLSGAGAQVGTTCMFLSPYSCNLSALLVSSFCAVVRDGRIFSLQPLLK